MRRMTLLIVLMVFFTAPFAKAEDNIFTSTTVLKEQVKRLGNEGLEVIKTPLDVKNYGLIGTLAVAGGVGFTYLFDNDIRKKVKDFYNRFRSLGGRKMMAKIQEETIRMIRSKDIGVFSLTANLKSILSWSHYADSHRGFCVGFHTWNLKAFLEKCGLLLDLRPVNYSGEYPFINGYRTSDEETTNKIVWTKSKDWGYEAEYRILYLTGANKPLKIPNGVIEEWFSGVRSALRI